MKSIRLYLLLFFVITYAFNKVEAQGLNHQWLLGSFYFFQDPKGRILFDSSSYTLINENRKMVFMGTEGNISDSNGNLLMSSNGVWIANANGDTMMNGSGLNPSSYTSSWPYGLTLPNANIILPFPGNLNRYILFHHSATFDGLSYPAYTLFSTTIDMTLDGGLGGVISKNDTIVQDTLIWGIGACRHANGRDWWIVALKNNSDLIYKILLDSSGISSITTQHLNVPPTFYNVTQPVFSPDGSKFAYTYSDGGSIVEHNVRIFDFDRCNGIFSNSQVIDIANGYQGFGVAFSPNSEYLYASSFVHIFQINAQTFSVDTVATYDGFISPPTSSCCATDFWTMYLAANGKIYLTSGSSVQHLHEINYPDSAGVSCDVQQHTVDLVSYLQLRAVPNHPNYYLGCDTTSGCPCLTTSIEQPGKHNFKFSISPNPTSGNIKIVYLLPQNKGGVFEVFDINGATIFSYTLPPWSTLQNFSLPHLADGLYNCVITSGKERISKKLAIISQH